MNSATTYKVIDIHTKQIIGEYATAKRARSAAERKNQAYGAHRFIVRLPELF